MFKDTSRQSPLFGADTTLSESARRRLQSSWAHGFLRDVYPSLLEVESDFAEFYGPTGRPNWSVARLLGVCILQEMQILTDQQAVDALCFDNRWRYALGFEADEDSYLSRQGLCEFRSRIATHDPEVACLQRVFEHVTRDAIRALGVSTSKQRIDSTLIQSNIRKRARLDLLGTTLLHGIQAIRKHDAAALQKLSPGLNEWLSGRDEGRGWFGDAGERTSLKQVGEWLLEVHECFGSTAPTDEIEAIQLVGRVLHEHFEFDPEPPPRGGKKSSKTKHRVTPRAHAVKAGAPSTLQSPHDPDAGMGHKGTGYMLHIVETCANVGAPELITAFKLNPANQADQNQAAPLCETLQARDLLPETLYADAGYVTPRAIEDTDARAVRLFGPVTGRGVASENLDRLDFSYDASGQVLTCPQGQTPQRHSLRKYENDLDRVSHAHFDAHQCRTCPRLKACPVRLKQNNAWLPLAPRLKARDAAYRAQQDPEWWSEYSIRSGIEGTMSELKRAHGCRTLRVRRRPRVKTALVFKLLACNVKRWTRTTRTAVI